MKTLNEYFQNENLILNENENIEEGLFSNAVSLASLTAIDSAELLEGILNMYDYICDEDDIKFFYQDFERKERPFWKNLYKLYENKVWSIIDVDVTNEENKQMLEECIPTMNTLMNVTPTFRRKLRFLINQSRNNKLELKPGAIKDIMSIYDPLKQKTYVLTLNKATGLFKRLFRAADHALLKTAFKKLADESASKSGVNYEKILPAATDTVNSIKNLLN